MLTRQLLLVVDDNADNRVVYSAVLEYAGYAVLTASRGDEAVLLAAKHRPSLILMDIAMPVMDGWAAMAALRTSPITSGIPVVAVTAQDVADLKKPIREVGFCAALQKPALPREVVEAVSRCLREHGNGSGWIELGPLDAGPPAP